MISKLISQRFIADNPGSLVVVMVSVLFITIRLAVPLKFDGSYIDEYWHIVSGISLFESGNYAYFYNSGKPYERGLLMSLWSGLWMALFGKSLFVAKLAPISVGIANYLLLLYLSFKLFDKRRFQILLLLLYTLSPWCIFNHAYIRMYVVYELFLLILLVLGFKMYNAVRENNGTKIFLLLLFITILNILNLATNTDGGRYLLPLASAVMFASLFIFEFNTEHKINRGLLGTISGSIFLSTEAYRAIAISVVAVLAFVVLDAGDKVDYLLNGKLSYPSKPEYKYSWFFWERNGIITAFFILAVISLWRKKRGFENIILPVAGAFFLLHIVSSQDLQIIRGVLYFMPLYYLTAVIGISKVSYPSEWQWYVVISCIFIVSTVTSVKRDYYWGPKITNEVNYIEYARLYDSVAENCQGKVIVEASPSSPFIAMFHGVKVEYALSAAVNAEKEGLYFTDPDTGHIRTFWGDLPVITDVNDLKLLNRDVCLIVRTPSKKRFLPSTANNMLLRADRSWNFHNINLYLLKQKVLNGDQ